MQKRIKYKNLQSEYCSSHFKQIREMIWILPVDAEIRGCLLVLCLSSLSFWSLSYIYGSTHFLLNDSELPNSSQQPAYNPLSLHLSLKAQCPVPALLLCSSLRRRWKIHWQLSISQTARSDWVSPGALTQCTTQLHPLFKRTFQLLHVCNHWAYRCQIVHS